MSDAILSRRAEVADLLEIKIEELVGTGPYQAKFDLSEPWIDEALQGGDSRAHGDGTLVLDICEQGNARYFVRGKLFANYLVPCARCLADATVTADGELYANYVPNGIGQISRKKKSSGAPEEDEEFESDGSVDQVPYDNKTLNFTQLVVEILLVAYPIRAYCARGESCAGLCSQCGRNLNEIEGSSVENPSHEQMCSSCALRWTEQGADMIEAETPWRKALRSFDAN